jgi:multiple sugar transport system substrate-binding protein
LIGNKAYRKLMIGGKGSVENRKISRRELLKWIGAGSAAAVLAGCAPAAAPTGGAAQQTSQEAAPAAAAESASSDAPTGDKVSMSVATFDAPLHDWQREFSKRWAEAHPDEVDLSIENVVYNEMSKLQLARSASGTLWDVVFSGIKWFPYSASKDMFLALDEALAARDDAKLDDFFETAIAGGYLDGKLYGLPYEIHPGNPALVVYNIDMLEEKGLALPTDDWDVNEYAELAEKATDRDNNIWGTNYLPGNYYDFQSLSRAYGTDLFDAERKQFTFNIDEKNITAAQWIVDLRTKFNAAASRAESEGLAFTSGTLATQVTGSYSVNGFATEIGDKFKHDWVLFPVGPDGDRGYTAFTSNFSVASTTVSPELAVDLLVYLTSTEAGLWSALEQGTGQPNARQSVWEDQTFLEKSHPVFKRVLEKLYLDPNVPGPFPMPYNLRFQEFQDNWANSSPELFYGEVGFEEGMQNVQDVCQEILDLPRA